MALTIPTTEPATVAAGTTWQWSRTLADFPPSEGWAVTYHFVGPTSLSQATTPRVPEGDYLLTVPAATTATVTAGTYRWTARATKGAEVYDADSGVLVVTANAAVVAGSDQRTHAERMVANIEAELQARVKGDGAGHESYQNADVSLTKLSVTELEAMLARYRLAVQRERNGGQLPPYRVSYARPD